MNIRRLLSSNVKIVSIFMLLIMDVFNVYGQELPLSEVLSREFNDDVFIYLSNKDYRLFDRQKIWNKKRFNKRLMIPLTSYSLGVFTEYDTNMYNVIDSLGLKCLSNDTIVIIQQEEEFLIKTNSYILSQGKQFYWSDKEGAIDSLKLVVKQGEADIKVSWVPYYLRQALMNKDFKVLNRLQKFYIKSKRYEFGSPYFHLNQLFRCSIVIVRNGNIKSKKNIYMLYFDIPTHILDQVYFHNQLASYEDRVIKNKIPYRVNKNIMLYNSIDSIVNNSLLTRKLKRGVIKWNHNYVYPMIDSLIRYKITNDTLYVQERFADKSNNIIGNLFVLNNENDSINFSIYELMNSTVCDTLKHEPMFLNLRDGAKNIGKYYDIYNVPGYFYGFELFGVGLNIKSIYDYSINNFARSGIGYFYTDVLRKTINKRRKVLRMSDDIEILVRIVVENGGITKVINDIRVDNHAMGF